MTFETPIERLTRINEAAARRLFDAVEHRNPGGVAAVYDPDIVINEAPSLPYGGTYRGYQGAARHGQGYRAAWDSVQPWQARGLEPLFVAQGEHVAVLWHHRAQNPSTGQSIDMPAAGFYRFAGARVVESRMFHFDLVALLNFLHGGSAPH